MRTRLLVALAAAVGALAMPAGAGAVIQSGNVDLVGKLPEAAGAIGAKFSPDGRTMYVTSASGLGIYDVSDPEDPQRLSRVPLPHFENEDVDVGRVAGKDIVLISNDPSFTAVGVIYVIDVTDPRVPKPLSATPTTVNPDSVGFFPIFFGEDANEPVNEALGLPGTYNGHILNCIQGCRYVWSTGTAEGITVFDFADPASPKYVGTFAMPAPKNRDHGGFTHDVQLDRSGIAWVTGEDGTFGYDTNGWTATAGEDGRVAPPPLVYRSDENVVNSGNPGLGFPDEAANGYPIDFLHHNSMRTGLNASDSPKGKTKPSKRPGLGNVMAITEEDYLRPSCQGQGSFQTWRIGDATNSDGTRKLEMLDLWTTELNELENGTGRSNEDGLPTTVNCSAHWFDEDRGLIAQGWYDQGIRFLDISDPRDVKQVGYYVTQGEFWAAYFAPTDRERETVYALDIAGGIDVLHIERDGRSASKERVMTRRQTRALASRRTAAQPHPVFGYACPLPR